MIGAVLVQNTRWKNVEAAIRSLRSAGCVAPEAISLQSLAGLEKLIRSAGCQSVKARRLKALADWVDDIGGIRRITRMPSGQLRKSLLSVHGIGSETADAILCFGFDRQTFIADRYARRWLGRMGVTGSEALISYERCRQFFGPQLENRKIDLANLHAAIVQHGQSVCNRV
jgi:endonuclease-3 related protein